MASHYEAIRDSFRNFTMIPGAGNLDQAMFGSHPEPYFEFDALLNSARRVYSNLQFVLWNRFGRKHDIPKQFDSTVKGCDRLPEPLRLVFLESWANWGRRIRAYRDCIAHNTPIDMGNSPLHMKEILPGFWSASARIPDNPEVQSRREFTYAEGLDALTFGWEVANEVYRINGVAIAAVGGAKLAKE
jgi:hypothetical protein